MFIYPYILIELYSQHQRKQMTFNLKNYAVLAFTLLSLSGCSTNKSLTTATQTKSDNSAVIEPVGSDKTLNTSVTKQALVPPDNPDKVTNAKVLQYVKLLTAKGFPGKNQGVWIQSENTLLANHQGTVPLPAASLSKVATTLIALQTFGAEHQFITRIGATGPIKDGVLKGDLIVEGAEDPFFVSEEAIALGNILNQVGIKRVTGNLVIVGKFYMNFKDDPLTTGNFIKQSFNSQIWSAEVKTAHQSLPPGTPQPQIIIDGITKSLSASPRNLQPLVQHYSYPLAELLKKMNLYSNNFMADKLADAVGGAKVVAQKAAITTGIPTAEIQLVNGSGLAIENRISPRAVSAMFIAIEKYLQPQNMTIADVFTIVGQDKGILDKRPLPKFAVVKSGSFDNTSNLAGALPTEKEKTVWFVIMNSDGKLDNLNSEQKVSGKSFEYFRTQQDVLLKSFANKWGTVKTQPSELTPNAERNSKTSRNEIVKK